MTPERAGRLDLATLPDDWRVEDYADGDLFAEPEGSRRIEERDRKRLRQRQAEIAAERARRA